MVLICPMLIFQRYLRTKFGTQAEAATFFGVSQGTISHWLCGRRVPKPETATDIVRRTHGRVRLEHIYGVRQ